MSLQSFKSAVTGNSYWSIIITEMFMLVLREGLYVLVQVKRWVMKVNVIEFDKNLSSYVEKFEKKNHHKLTNFSHLPTVYLALHWAL